MWASSNWTRGLILVSTFTLAVEIIHFIYKRRKTKSKSKDIKVGWNQKVEDARLELEKRKPFARWNNALFFPPLPVEISGSESGTECPKEQIAYYFQNALQSIQMCTLLFSEYNLTEIIKAKQREGLLIRVITDYDTMNERSMNSSCRAFARIGIPVRTKNTGHLMHNKFVIFDEEAVLTGSLNFTKQAILGGNFENVIVTTDERIVKKYIHEFGVLWKECHC